MTFVLGLTLLVGWMVATQYLPGYLLARVTGSDDPSSDGMFYGFGVFFIPSVLTLCWLIG